MDLKELREGLSKARDPEKFLRDLLEKTKDEKLKDLIKQLLEKKKSFGESKLENVVRKENVDFKPEEPKLTIQVPEVEEVRVETKEEFKPPKEEKVDYGIKTSGSYTDGGLIKQSGSASVERVSESSEKRMGEYDSSLKGDKYEKDKGYEPEARDSFAEETVFDGVIGVDRDKKKKRIGDYV
jgi:hypothetical protein